MTLYVDADGCPVVNIAVKLAGRYGVACVLLCDTAHALRRPGARTVTVSKGADSVDFALVNLVKPGDLVVTQDYGLAALCLARGAKALNQNGRIYDENNIDSLLGMRHISKKVRRAGGRMKGPPKRTKEQDEWFEQSLERLLSEGIPE